MWPMTRRLVKLVLIAAAVALVAGFVLGTRSTAGAKHLKTVEAEAKLESAATGLALADATDGDEQFSFNVHTIAWASSSEHGESDPPCLRQAGKKVKVEIGYLDLTTPDGTTYHDVALWIRCP